MRTSVKKSWRFWLALWTGKFFSIALKITGKKGTTFPGLVANRIEPRMINLLSQAYTDGIIIVTGTNGKTTTANLLANILRVAGKKFAFNQAGANLVTGITGALLEYTRWTGTLRVKLALLEVDEATVPKLCQEIAPAAAIITNFFRDQLDRYGELDTTVRFVKEALPEKTTLILNADDPLVAQFGLGRTNVMYYGVEQTPDSKKESSETREARFCPRCGTPLTYTLFHYGQLGFFHCPDCYFQRPQPQVLAQNVHPENGNILFRIDITSYSIALQGYYNLYNSLAALTAARFLGINELRIARGLQEFVPQAGRMERFYFVQGEITLTLVKNPTGFNQVIRTILSLNKKTRLLIAINDLAADGRDISWLWDVDFEQLGAKETLVQQVVCSGLRAEDMALRLKYAGIPESKLLLEHSLEKAVGIIQDSRRTEEAVYALPTYTLLFPLREILAAQSKKNPGSDISSGERREEAQA